MRLLSVRRLATLAGFSVACAAVVLGAQQVRPTPAQAAKVARDGPPAEIAIVATAHDPAATTSEVRLVTVGSTASTIVLGSIAHAPGAVIRGDVLPGARAVVLAADGDGASRDWSSALYVVDERGARVLVQGLYHASRPLASVDGAVYVQRGREGALPLEPGGLRTDALTIDAVDPRTGAAHAIYSWTGYTLHIAGELGAELLVYRVANDTADLVAIDRATGASRLVTTLLPFARDFSVDAVRGVLVLSNRDENDAHLWVIDRIDLQTGLRTRLASARDEAPAPFALPSGELAWTARERGGLAIGRRTIAPLGAGFDAVTQASADGAWLTVLHAAHGFDVAVAVHLAAGTPTRLTAGDERVEPLGFIGTKASSVR